MYIWHPTQCQYEVTKMTQRTKQVSRLLAKATLPLLTTKSCPWQDRQNTSQHGQCDLRKLHPCNHSLGLIKAYSDAIGSIYMMTKKKMTSAQSHDHQQLYCGERLNIRCCQLLVLAVVCLVLLGKKKAKNKQMNLRRAGE